ncbi:MAG: hypothetical protein ABIG60_01245 [Patescibacteria group bacterium]
MVDMGDDFYLTGRAIKLCINKKKKPNETNEIDENGVKPEKQEEVGLSNSNLKNETSFEPEDPYKYFPEECGISAVGKGKRMRF